MRVESMRLTMAPWWVRLAASTGVILALALASVGCASRAYVREQVGTTESRLSQTDQRLDSQESQLAAGRQRMAGIDDKLGQVGTLALQASERAGEASTLAREARKSADDASAGVRDLEGRLQTRMANRNRYTALETKSIRFDFGKTELSDEGITELRELARALRQDPNAVVELRGHTDAMGPARLNLQLSRDRVDVIVRHLVQKERIELRRIHAVGLGKEAPTADNNTREGRAKNRRVDVTLLSPQS